MPSYNISSTTVVGNVRLIILHTYLIKAISIAKEAIYQAEAGDPLVLLDPFGGEDGFPGAFFPIILQTGCETRPENTL